MTKLQGFCLGSGIGMLVLTLIYWAGVNPQRQQALKANPVQPVTMNSLTIPTTDFIQICPLVDGRLLVEFHVQGNVVRYYYVWENGKPVLTADN